MNGTGTVAQIYDAKVGIALDIDGTSFWTFYNCPVRIDIATAARGICPPSSEGFNGIAVVGEPRLGLPPFTEEVHAPAIPTLSPLALAAVAVALAAIALATIRVASQ